MTLGRVVAAIATLALAVPAATLSAQTTPHTYRVEDLGSFGGSILQGIAINSSGEIAGTALTADGLVRAFRWTPSGGLEDLGTNGGVDARAFAINDHGDIVGLYTDQDGIQHPFIAPKQGPMRELSGYPALIELNGINNDGRLTGTTSGFRAFRTWADGALQELHTQTSNGIAINAAGDVAGYGFVDPTTESRKYTAFRYSDAAGYVDLGTLSGVWSVATGISADGTVVGYYDEGTTEGSIRAFRARPGLPMEDLGLLPGGFFGGIAGANGINDAGEIVGMADRPGEITTAFLYTDAEGMVDLNRRISIHDRAAYPIFRAHAISSAGEIVAEYWNGERYGTVRLVPRHRIDPPVSRPAATPPVLRRSDGRMVPVSIDPRASDEFDPEPSCHITHVTNSDFPFLETDPDVQITSPLTVDLRATTRGGLAGRAYLIAVACSNYLGKTSKAYTYVVVSRY